ncbi:DUF721 domain-containing protein [Silicimonas sp. MF1-12-2]|jgi:hypothetical protein|uniref:DUF721 domain-containing protein n=1 Tax=Silicimonas sp. MF1-12-2 TaxID=3384793 RepID=UPI0039B5F43E
MSDIASQHGAKRRKKGFERASSLVAGRVRSAGEARGFAVTRLLTHWPDIVGPDIAAAARPVEVSYGRGFGATLTLLTTGAQAPMLEMQKETIREKVNACYGYAAIQRVRLTQTAATGFAEGKAQFDGYRLENDETIEREVPLSVQSAASGVEDNNLRMALERLGANVLSRKKQ